MGVSDACGRPGAHSRASLGFTRGLRPILEQLGCERIEAESAAEISGILAIRFPTLASIALDMMEAEGFAPLKRLAAQGVRPATVFRGACTRPLDEVRLEQLILAQIRTLLWPIREKLEHPLLWARGRLRCRNARNQLARPRPGRYRDLAGPGPGEEDPSATCRVRCGPSMSSSR